MQRYCFSCNLQNFYSKFVPRHVLFDNNQSKQNKKKSGIRIILPCPTVTVYSKPLINFIRSSGVSTDEMTTMSSSSSSSPYITYS